MTGMAACPVIRDRPSMIVRLSSFRYLNGRFQPIAKIGQGSVYEESCFRGKQCVVRRPWRAVKYSGAGRRILLVRDGLSSFCVVQRRSSRWRRNDESAEVDGATARTDPVPAGTGAARPGSGRWPGPGHRSEEIQTRIILPNRKLTCSSRFLNAFLTSLEFS